MEFKIIGQQQRNGVGQIVALLLLYAVGCVFTMFFFDGTGDSGDSILHYQFAKFAPRHIALFFDHWAKPIYVLFVSPFAQLGFVGVKLFNVIVSLLTVFLTFKTAEKLTLRNPIVGALILIFCPLCFVLTFSGLTEPLFALFLIAGVYAALINKYVFSSLLISFLPFVRSEGLIFMGVFFLYFILNKQWRITPLLLVGHVAYSIAGFFIYKDFFWVFTKIPYASMNSTYGQGKAFHFLEQLIYVVGIPIYVLFWIGVVVIIWKTIKHNEKTALQILVFVGFFSFFIAHSLFWYLGIFNSMGLIRVFIGVAPLMAIISLVGFNFITEDLFKNKTTLKYSFQGAFIIYIVIFPFTSNPAAINWNKDLSLSQDQLSVIQVANFITQHKSAGVHRYVFSNPYLSEALNIDPFDIDVSVELTKPFIDNVKTGDFIVWENWFAVRERGITKEDLDNNNTLRSIYNLRVWDGNQEILYSVYEKH